MNQSEKILNDYNEAKSKLNVTVFIEKEYDKLRWPRAFLDHYSLHANESLAAKECGVSMRTVENLKRNCLDFYDDFHEVRESHIDTIESVIIKNAIEGNTKAGMFVLERRRPGIYGPKIENEKNIEIVIDNTPFKQAIDTVYGSTLSIEDKTN